MIKIFSLLFLFYIVVCAYLYFTQDKKVFNRIWAKEYTPKIAKKIYFDSSVGKLEGAIVKNKEKAPLVLYFSGNANNVIEFLDKIAPKIKNYNFFGFNYPGYVNSEGVPSEENFYKMADEIFKKYKPDFVIGRSIGTAVASYLASKYKFRGLLLITPFDNLVSIAKYKYPFLPVKLLLKYKFPESEFLAKSNIPTVVIALKKDNLIPQKSLKNLLKNIKNLKEVIYLDGVSHAEIYHYENIEKIIQEALNKLKDE